MDKTTRRLRQGEAEYFSQPWFLHEDEARERAMWAIYAVETAVDGWRRGERTVDQVLGTIEAAGSNSMKARCRGWDFLQTTAPVTRFRRRRCSRRAS